ncbi:MAG: hypothetical protein ACRELE_01325, partial [Gemmatimonadales bacterium]
MPRAPARIGVTATALVHGTLIAVALLLAHRAQPTSSIVYEVSLVAAPLPSPAVRNAAPEAIPTAPDEVAPTVVHPRIVKPVRKPPLVQAKRVDPTPVTRTTATAA